MKLDNISPSIESLTVGKKPDDVVVNPITALVYTVNETPGTISVIDEYTNTVIKNITVGTFPERLSINPYTNLIYVSNMHSDTVSVIDGKTNSVIANIPVGSFPYDIAVNTKTDKIYVANSQSHLISIIDGKTNNELAGVTFNISPKNSGSLVCNNNKILANEYIRVNVSSYMACHAVANSGFTFSSWSGSLSSNSQDNPLPNFKVLHFGDLTANFIESPPPLQFTIPPETLVQILLIIITAIVGWSIPSIVSGINKHRQKKSLVAFMSYINNNSNNKNQLEDLKKEISKNYAKGKISQSNYEILNDKISEYLEEIGKT